MLPSALLLALSLLVPRVAAAGGGCVVMPDGSCRVEQPRVLPADALDERLPGGVRVVVVPLPATERVAVDVLLGVSQADPARLDPLVAHLLAEELADPSGPARRERRRVLGVEQALDVQSGRVRIELEGPPAALPELLALEAARLSSFAPTGREIARAHLEVQAADASLVGDPDRLARRLVERRPALPVVPDTAQVLDRHAGAWEGAALAVLISGPVQPQAALDAARAALGGLQVADAPSPRPESVDAPDRVELSRPSVARSRVLLSWPVPPALPGTRRAAALALLRELLIAPGGTLDRRILAEGLGLRVESRADPTRLEVLAEVAAGVHPGAVEAAMELGCAELLTADAATIAPVVELARAHLLREVSLDLDSPAGWNRALGAAVAEGARLDALDRHLDLVSDVRADEVLALAAELLQPGHRRSVVLTPAPVLP